MMDVPIFWQPVHPNRQGWYWYRPTQDALPDMVYIFRDHVTHETKEPDCLWQLHPCSTECRRLDSLVGEWAGPILKPGEEK